MKTRSGLSSSTEKDHEKNRPTAMKRDEEHVRSLIDHVKNNMTDDVEACPKDLINIATGLHAKKKR